MQFLNLLRRRPIERRQRINDLAKGTFKRRDSVTSFPPLTTFALTFGHNKLPPKLRRLSWISDNQPVNNCRDNSSPRIRAIRDRMQITFGKATVTKWVEDIAPVTH